MKTQKILFPVPAIVAMTMSLLLGASTAQAEVILNAVEVDGDVIISGGGSLNLDAWEAGPQDEAATPLIAPASADVFVGFKGGEVLFTDRYAEPLNYEGPNNFGFGTLRAANVAEGDLFGSDPSGPFLFVPNLYVSGDPLSGEAVFTNTTFNELGLEVGTYMWTWGSGETADSFTLNVPGEDNGNLPPMADPGGPYTYPVGLLVAFDGGASSDQDGTIERYEWDWGDGQHGEGTSPYTAHTYEAPGPYHVTLTVTDNDGAPDSKTTTAFISDIDENPAGADAGGPYFGTAGAAVSFDGTGSTPQDGTITTYDWDFGDGFVGEGPTPSHTYDGFGRYIVTLKVITEGESFDMDATTVSIGDGNLPPNADANGPYTGRAGEAITFDGSASSDRDGDILTYEWRFGDGSAPTTTTPPPFVTHTYRGPGLYNVILIVTDDDGVRDSHKTFAVISPRDQPLNCSGAVPSIDTLWPPNRRFRSVQILGVTSSPLHSIVIEGIFQDERVGRRPDGRGVGTDTALLRAQRRPGSIGGNGRVYRIDWRADDGQGAFCTGSETVAVPLRRFGEAIDDGTSFDSTVPSWWGWWRR